MKTKLLFIVCLIAVIGARMATSAEVAVAFSPYKPPYVIGKEHRGLEIDIVREALENVGHTLKIDYFDRQFSRNAIAFGRTDAAAGLKIDNDDLFYSDIYISFQNTIISHADAKIKLESIADLKGRRFSAWRNAYQNLGEEYKTATENGTSPSYLEYDNQLIQNKMFWSRRIDLLVIDQYVFNWYRQRLSEDFITTGEIANHPLLPLQTHYRLGFKAPSYRDDFNRGLKQLIDSGRYDELKDRYLVVEMSQRDEPVYLHYNERPPYLVSGNNGVFGLTATPAGDAFKRAGVHFSWQKTPGDKQLELLKKNNRPECLVGWFKNAAREKYAKFTVPIYTDKPQVALTRKDNPLQHDSLQTLFTNSKQVLLVKEAYSYGVYIDQLISAQKPRRIITTLENTGMLRALHNHQADYMLIAPEEAEQALVAADLDPEAFTMQPLSDVPFGETRHIVCTMQVRDETIRQLNKAIQQRH